MGFRLEVLGFGVVGMSGGHVGLGVSGSCDLGLVAVLRRGLGVWVWGAVWGLGSRLGNRSGIWVWGSGVGLRLYCIAVGPGLGLGSDLGFGVRNPGVGSALGLGVGASPAFPPRRIAGLLGMPPP